MAHEINNPLGFVRSNLSTFTHYLQKLSELKGRLADAPNAWRELDMDFVLEDRPRPARRKRRSGSNASPASSPT